MGKIIGDGESFNWSSLDKINTAQKPGKEKAVAWRRYNICIKKEGNEISLENKPEKLTFSQKIKRLFGVGEWSSKNVGNLLSELMKESDIKPDKKKKIQQIAEQLKNTYRYKNFSKFRTIIDNLTQIEISWPQGRPADRLVSPKVKERPEPLFRETVKAFNLRALELKSKDDGITLRLEAERYFASIPEDKKHPKHDRAKKILDNLIKSRLDQIGSPSELSPELAVTEKADPFIKRVEGLVTEALDITNKTQLEACSKKVAALRGELKAPSGAAVSEGDIAIFSNQHDALLDLEKILEDKNKMLVDSTSLAASEVKADPFIEKIEKLTQKAVKIATKKQLEEVIRETEVLKADWGSSVNSYLDKESVLSNIFERIDMLDTIIEARSESGLDLTKSLTKSINTEDLSKSISALSGKKKADAIEDQIDVLTSELLSSSRKEELEAAEKKMEALSIKIKSSSTPEIYTDSMKKLQELISKARDDLTKGVSLTSSMRAAASISDVSPDGIIYQKGDGNCLYRSIATALERAGVKSFIDDPGVKSALNTVKGDTTADKCHLYLRQQAIQYIKDNYQTNYLLQLSLDDAFSDYVGKLQKDIIAATDSYNTLLEHGTAEEIRKHASSRQRELEESKKVLADVLKLEPGSEESRDLYLDIASRDKQWATQVEMQALALKYGVNIRVYPSGSDVPREGAGYVDDTYTTTISLQYTGDHYNVYVGKGQKTEAAKTTSSSAEKPLEQVKTKSSENKAEALAEYFSEPGTMPLEETLLDQAKQSIEKWTTERAARKTPLSEDRKYMASTERLTAIAKVKLKKETVTDEEIAQVAGKSVATYRAMRVQEAYERIGKFDTLAIAAQLKCSEIDVNNWLIASQKEAWISDQLSYFGLDFDADFSKIPKEVLEPKLAMLGKFFVALEESIQNCSKPFDILKLYTIKMHLEQLKEDSSLGVEKLQSQCTTLIGKVIDNMNRMRRGALIGLIDAGSTPKPLREQVYSQLFGVAISPEGASWVTKTSVTKATGATPEDQVSSIKDKSHALKALIDKVLTSPDIANAYEESKDQLPLSIRRFCDEEPPESLKERLDLMLKKLDAVIARQENRLNILKDGGTLQLPLFFHATSDSNIAFSMVASGIRPSKATFYGAFVSTYPGMLRYGGVILGLPAKAAFQSEMSEKDRFKDQVLLIPDRAAGINPGIFKESKREKWVGFEDMVGISVTSQEMKNKFLENFISILRKHIPKEKMVEVEAKFTAYFEENHLYFAFDPSEKDPSKGVWTAQIEDPEVLKFGPYKALDEKVFSTICDKVGTSEIAGTLWKAVKPEFRKEGSRGMTLQPYIFSMDSDKALISHFERMGRSYFNPVASEDIESIKTKYKASIGYEKITDPIIKKQVDQYVETHFIPLMEQLIEFDLSSEEGVHLLKKWLPPEPVKEPLIEA